MADKVKPYSEAGSKKEQVRSMFDNIAHRYDFLNRFLSMGIDRSWRNKAVRMLREDNPKRILDVATGTGDFALACLRLNPEEVVGIDISEGMLQIGREKMDRKGISNIQMLVGDSEDLPFDSDSFDAIVVGFGVRNFEDLEKGMNEMLRVLRPEGRLLVLEFSKPRGPFRLIYNFYFNVILPAWGRLFSGDQSAYTYLPESVKAFPEGDEFKNIMRSCGYQNVSDRRLTFGICSIYSGRK